MFTVLTIMAAGVVLGFLLRNKTQMLTLVDPLINAAIFALLFLLGVSVGTNQIILSNLDTLGAHALVLMIGGVVGSVVLAFFVYRMFFKARE